MRYNTTPLLISTVLAGILTTMPLLAAGQDARAVEIALQLGLSQNLGQQFAKQVELRFLDFEGTLPPDRAEAELAKFFQNHQPSDFTVVHRNNRGGNTLIIGTLSCGAEKYRVTVLLQGEPESMRITKLQIIPNTM